MSIILPHCVDSTALLMKVVQAALSHKYQNIFAFYKVKSINELLYGCKTKNYIDLCDARTLSEEAEFLRRMYYYHTMTGREEIFDRLRLCGQYYSKNNGLGSEYPMMIITKTKSLFLKRNKRLKKIQAGQASSDDSAEPQEQRMCFQEESVDVLDDLDNSSLEDDLSSEVEFEFDYDSQDIDVYQGEGDGSGIQAIKLKNILEGEVGHLIEDMSKAVGQSREKADPKRLPMLNENTLKNIENKLRGRSEDSISIVPIEHNASKASNFFLRPNSFDSTQKATEQSLGISYTKLHQKADNVVVQVYKKAGHSTTFETLGQSNEDECLQLQMKRKKIREKAQELLRRVRRQQSQCF